jgi:cytochrome c556
MRPILIAFLVATGCGSTPVQPTTPPLTRPLHSTELGRIMKEEVNQPYSALAFTVFHSDNGIDYAALAAPAEALRAGIAKVRYIADPPAETSEARAVFFTFLDSLAVDAERFSVGFAQRDPQVMAAALGRISDTCNSCHHFFRLDIQDTPAH